MRAMPGPLVVSDMDGTLATVDTWRGVHAWIRACYPSREADRFVRVRMPSIVKARVFGFDKEGFRARWQEDQARLLEGMDATRLDELAASVVEEHLWPSRREAAVDAVHAAIETARAADPAARLVLATGGWQPLGDAFARRLGADLALGTPLEVRDGVVTGRTVVPTQSGVQKAAAVRALAAGSAIVAAFGDTAADVALLELAERPVAVAPDTELRREAVRRGWEILEA
jgi:HAD superfamily phosphoserine phosphatase-like hydrolase